MFRLSVIALLLLLVLLIVACSPAPAAQRANPASTGEAAPDVTAEPTITLTASPTPIRRATLPPTWTPTAEPTEEPTSEVDAEGGDGDESQASSAFNTCQEFGPDFRRSETLTGPGEAVDVFWSPAGRAVFYYEVTLKDLNGAELDSGRTTPRTTSYTFDGRLFEPNQIYMWTITPYDSSANVLCDSRTSEIRVHGG